MQNATKVIKKLMKYSCKQQILYFKLCVNVCGSRHIANPEIQNPHCEQEEEKS